MSMETDKETKGSEESIPDGEYAIARLMSYAIGGIGFFLIFLKLLEPF